MTVFLNGQFLPSEKATVSVFERGFTYGDGLFETIRIRRGAPFRWSAHLERAQRAAAFLGIAFPTPLPELRVAADTLIDLNQVVDGILRLVLSRGPSARGYSPRGAHNPTLVMTMHEAPPQPTAPWRLQTSTFRLYADDPILQHKSCNKLVQVLARAEAEAAGFTDALLLNHRQEAVTASSANLFWLAGKSLGTPPRTAGALPGVTRQAVLDLCEAEGVAYAEKTVSYHQLVGSDGIFLTSSSLGIVPVQAIDQHTFPIPELVQRLGQAYAALDT